MEESNNQELRRRRSGEDCNHDYEPTLQGGDTYRCRLCGKEIDMTEDE